MAKNKKKKNAQTAEASSDQNVNRVAQNVIPEDSDTDELEKELLALFDAQSNSGLTEGEAAAEAKDLLRELSELSGSEELFSGETGALLADVIEKNFSDQTDSSPNTFTVQTENEGNPSPIEDEVPPSTISDDPKSLTADPKTSFKEKVQTKEGSPLHMLKLVLILAAICTGISGMLAVVNHVTKDKISENDRKAREEAVLTVFSEGELCKEYITPNGDTVYFVAKGETVLGYCVNVSPAGYGGNIDMMVGISPDGEISGIKIVKLSETPGVGTKVRGDSFLSQFLGLSSGEDAVIGENIDTIGGATFSSRAVANGVNEALALSFDLNLAAEEMNLKLPDSTQLPPETEDSNAENGDETLMPGEAGEIGETEPVESETVEQEETVSVETNPIESETIPPEIIEPETEAPTPETTPTEPDIWIPEPVIPDTDPVETTPPETEPAQTEAPATEPIETEAPETVPVETEAPETVPVETEAPETVPVETEAPDPVPVETEEPETLPVETDAPETIPVETDPPETEPAVMQYNLTLRAVDFDGNILTDVLDARLNNDQWISSAYSTEYTVYIGTNTVSEWDAVPQGYFMPNDFGFLVLPDGNILCSDGVTAEIDGYDVVFIIVLEEEPYGYSDFE